MEGKEDKHEETKKSLWFGLAIPSPFPSTMVN
jgi:hypothetical protein